MFDPLFSTILVEGTKVFAAIVGVDALYLPPSFPFNSYLELLEHIQHLIFGLQGVSSHLP